MRRFEFRFLNFSCLLLAPETLTIYIIRHHQLRYHMYADDTQLYISISPLCAAPEAKVLPRIEHCFEDINCWTAHNQLKLNNEKTEVIICGRKHDIKHINIPTIDIGGCDIPVCNSAVRNLGVMTDPEVSMARHINRLCQSLHYHLCNIGKIRCYLSRSSTEQLIHSLVSGRLDYGNALLYGVPPIQINRLQKFRTLRHG